MFFSPKLTYPCREQTCTEEKRANKKPIIRINNNLKHVLLHFAKYPENFKKHILNIKTFYSMPIIIIRNVTLKKYI